MSNTIDFENILFWLSFVALIIFLVRGIYSSVLLRVQKLKEYPQSEFFITILTATFAIFFTVMSLTNYKDIQYMKNNPTSITSDEHHIKLGKIILYDSTDNPTDTLILYTTKKE